MDNNEEVVQTTQEPVVEPKTETVNEPIIEPKVETPTKPVTEPVAEKTSASDTTDLVKQAGIDPEVMSKQMAEHGELTPAQMKALVEEHGETVANLIVDSVTKIQTEAKARVEATNNTIFSEVEQGFGLEKGQGKEAFAELSAWTRENAEPEELAALNAMLNAGGFQAKLAIQTLANAYKQSDAYTQEADLTSGDAAGSVKGDPISASEYSAELDKLLEAGHAYESQKVKDLKKRRAASRARGY